MYKHTHNKPSLIFSNKTQGTSVKLILKLRLQQIGAYSCVIKSANDVKIFLVLS